MESSRPQSFFLDVRSSELSGFRAKKRLGFGEFAWDFKEIGAVDIEHDLVHTPPLAVSFCKTSRNSHVFAVSDEEGCVNLFDSRRKFDCSASHRDNAERVRICEWDAHQNAIFDICWIKDDKNLLTASGDQTIKVWDANEKKCIGDLTGHTGSVKSICSHPTNPDLIVSGARDGCFNIWDLRCNSNPRRRNSVVCIPSSAMVKKAHDSSQDKRIRRGKAPSVSITSVLYLKDEVSIATAGAANSFVKFWDVRNLKAHTTQAGPDYQSSTVKEQRLHGISSLSQDSNGVFLTASCMDNRIYLYNVLQLEKGPIQSFSGAQIQSFYVKSAISPDASHILSGSSDGNAYVWQVNKPQLDPIMLKAHDGEVTTVDWCSSEVGKIASASDDFTVRVWNAQSNFHSTSAPPASNRRRVMAMPSTELNQLMKEQENTNLSKTPNSLHSSDEPSVPKTNSSNPIEMPIVTTPDAQKRKISSISDSTEPSEKTLEVAVHSPSSVLNPPSSVKRRTIRDYFVVAP